MALITKVKAGSVSSLSDARYFAGMGVDWLGFNVTPDSPHYVSPELYQSMAGWVAGPQRVIELSQVNTDTISTLLTTYSPDFIEVEASQVTQLKSITQLALMARLDLDAVHPNLHELGQAKYAIVHTLDALKHKEIIRSISKVTEVLLAVSQDEHQVNSLLTLLPIAGICLKGSPEVKVGLKDYGYADLLESLEEV